MRGFQDEGLKVVCVHIGTIRLFGVGESIGDAGDGSDFGVVVGAWVRRANSWIGKLD